jgi:hypothetical protein
MAREDGPEWSEISDDGEQIAYGLNPNAPDIARLLGGSEWVTYRLDGGMFALACAHCSGNVARHRADCPAHPN